jgi:hypothetical protein
VFSLVFVFIVSALKEFSLPYASLSYALLFSFLLNIHLEIS